jgi:hypothetical protein
MLTRYKRILLFDTEAQEEEARLCHHGLIVSVRRCTKRSKGWRKPGEQGKTIGARALYTYDDCLDRKRGWVTALLAGAVGVRSW